MSRAIPETVNDKSLTTFERFFIQRIEENLVNSTAKQVGDKIEPNYSLSCRQNDKEGTFDFEKKGHGL